MIKLFLSGKKNLLIGLLTMFFSMPLLATNSSTNVQAPTVKPGALILWEAGSIYSLYVRSPFSKLITRSCPSGMKPYYSLAVRTGFIASSGNSDDKGIRGFHVKAEGCSGSSPGDVSGLCAAGNDALTNQVYIRFTEVYTDVIGGDDKGVDVSYWIYCGQ